MNKIVLLCLCLASLWADRSGPYLGIGYGLSPYNNDGYYKDIGFTTVSDDRLKAFRVYGGAYINEYFSVELDYTDFDVSGAKNGSGQSIQNDFSAMSVSTLVHYPAWDKKIDWYAKFGAGEIRWKQSGAQHRADEAGGLLVGAGVGYRFMQRLTFKVGYDIFFFGLKDSLLEKEYNMDFELFYGAVEVQF